MIDPSWQTYLISHGCRVCYEHEASGSSKHEKMSLQLQVKKFFQPQTAERPFSLVLQWQKETPGDLELHVKRHQIRMDSRESNFPRLLYWASMWSLTSSHSHHWYIQLCWSVNFSTEKAFELDCPWLRNAVLPRKVTEPEKPSTTKPNPCKERNNFEEVLSISTS